jgi:hypothetical protein
MPIPDPYEHARLSRVKPRAVYGDRPKDGEADQQARPIKSNDDWRFSHQ